MSKPKLHEVDGTKVFEFKSSTILRHQRVISALVPYFGAFVIVSILISVFANPLFAVILAFALTAIGIPLCQSKVHVAVMPGLIMVDEHSKYFSESHEFSDNEVDWIGVHSQKTKKHGTYHILKLRLTNGFEYTLPGSDKPTLDEIAHEIRSAFYFEADSPEPEVELSEEVVV